MLSPNQKAKIEEIRQSVSEMIAFRDGGDVLPVFRPSAFWKKMNRYLSYIRDLPVEQLENIRCHIGMGFFIGNPWDKDFYAGFHARRGGDISKFLLVQKYRKYTSDLPERYWCSEAATNDLVADIGINYQGRIINSDIVKEQACVRNLFDLGLIGDDGQENPILLELGPGYGQLVFQLSRMLGDRCRFVGVDYPETLFWSAIFLAINTDPDKIYIWKKSDIGVDLSALSSRYQFIMVPNFAITSLGDSPRFDLVLNQNSFQEMAESQIAYYAEYFSRTTCGWLYSYNARRQFMNDELMRCVDEVLGDYFIGGPDDAHYRSFGIDPNELDSKRIFLGYSRLLPVAPKYRVARGNSVWLSDKLVQI